MADWHTTEYLNATFEFAKANECTAKSTSREGANGATWGMGGGVTTFTSSSVGKDANSEATATGKGAGDNYKSTNSGGTLYESPAVDYNDSDPGVFPATVNNGVQTLAFARKTVNGTSNSGETNETAGGRAGVQFTDKNFGTNSKYSFQSNKHVRHSTPADVSNWTNVNTSKFVGNTKYRPNDGNGGSGAGKTKSGGYYVSGGKTSGVLPGLDSTFVTYSSTSTFFDPDDEDNDAMELSVSTSLYSREIKATRGYSAAGKNSTKAFQHIYTATFGDYTFVYFEDSETFFGNKTGTITYENINNDYSEPAEVNDDDPTEEGLSVQVEDSNGESSDVGLEGEDEDELGPLPDQPGQDTNSPGNAAASAAGYLSGIKGTSYNLSDYSDVGFSYGTKTAEGTYYFTNENGATDTTYSSTVIDYGEEDYENYNYCGNITITKEKYELSSVDSTVDASARRADNYYNTYGLSTVMNKTEYVLGGKVGVRSLEEANGTDATGFVNGVGLSYGTSASWGAESFDRVVSFAPRGTGYTQSTRVALAGQSYRTQNKDKLTKTITYWTTGYNSETRSSIGYFGLQGSVPIYDIFTSTYENQVHNGTENRDDPSDYSEQENYQKYYGSAMTATKKLTSRHFMGTYTASFVDWGGEGMITVTRQRSSYDILTTSGTITRGRLYDDYGITEKMGEDVAYQVVGTYGGDNIEFYSQKAINDYQVNVFKTDTSLGQGEGALTPPELKFTEEYLKSVMSNGQTAWTSIDERTDSHWSIPGFMPYLSKGRFHPILDDVSIPNQNGSITADGNDITQLRTVQLTCPHTFLEVDDSEQPPTTETITEIFTFTQTLRRTISLNGGLESSDTGYAIGSPIMLMQGQFPLTGQIYFGGGMGYDVPGTANVGPGNGLLMNEDGTTNLGYNGQQRTITLDTGPMLYKHPYGASSGLEGTQHGFQYFSRDVDPYEDYYEC
jgi:hypothetical protein